MAVKGYKQSEVGLIPENWHTAFLDSVAKRGSGHTPDKKHSEYWNGDIKWISLADSSALDNLYISETLANVTPLGIANSSAVIHTAGTVVMSRDAGIGKSAIITDAMAVSQHFMAWQCTPKLNNKFLYYWLQSKKPEFERIGNGSTIKTIGLDYFRNLKVPLPTPGEQRAIATALSDVDALLGGLDRLIAKKRDLKDATMQQLLVAQIRLPGFEGSWKVKRLADAFTISVGKSKSAYLVGDGDFWVCDMGSVSIEGRLVVSKRTNYRGDFLERGDLIMPKDDIGGGNIIGKVGYVDANDTYILSDHVYCLRALDGDSRFLAYVINSHRVNSELRKKVIGSAQLGLGRKSVNEQEIQFPPHAEQTAIAEVLTEMDGELAVLEERRAKTRMLKEGMMQELLTGRTRLI